MVSCVYSYMLFIWNTFNTNLVTVECIQYRKETAPSSIINKIFWEVFCICLFNLVVFLKASLDSISLFLSVVTVPLKKTVLQNVQFHIQLHIQETTGAIWWERISLFIYWTFE
jgi:hypothetical protein